MGHYGCLMFYVICKVLLFGRKEQSGGRTEWGEQDDTQKNTEQNWYRAKLDHLECVFHLVWGLFTINRTNSTSLSFYDCTWMYKYSLLYIISIFTPCRLTFCHKKQHMQVCTHFELSMTPSHHYNK